MKSDSFAEDSDTYLDWSDSFDEHCVTDLGSKAIASLKVQPPTWI